MRNCRQARSGARTAVLVLCAALIAASASAQGRAYVAHGSANAVTEIDTVTNTVVRVIPVGVQPASVVVSPDGAQVFVGNAGGASVSVVDAATGAVSRTIALGGNPSHLAIAPNGAWLYAMLATGVVEVIDTATGGVTASIPIGAAGGMAITPDGSRLYIGATDLVVVETATNAVLTRVPVDTNVNDSASTWAVGAAVVAGGSKAYVTVNSFINDAFGFSGSGGVVVVDTASNTVTRQIWLGGLMGPIAVTPDGSRAYAAIDAVWVNTGYGAAFIPGRSVSVIDAVTDTSSASIDLGAGGANWTLQNTARGLAVGSDRRFVYASVPRLSVVMAAPVNTNVVSLSIPVTAGAGAIGAGTSGGALVPYVVDAVDDSAIVSSAGGDAVANVLLNDRIGGLRATLAHVTLALVESSSPAVTLDTARAAVVVAPDAPLGPATLTYRICEIADPANCDNAVVSITVRAPFVIDAVNDSGTAFPGRTLPSVLANDTLDGVAATTALVTITPTTFGTDVSINPTSGIVLVAATATYGQKTLGYRICEKASLVNCDDATVTVTVVPYVVNAVDDAGTVTRAGGTAVANVLANDTFNGQAATFTTVALSLDGTAPAGITLNTSTGAVTVANGTAKGTYTLQYRLCEKSRADNCDTATVTVTVTSYAIRAVNDAARGSSKYASTILASVLANDTLGGLPATVANVKLTRVSLTPANSRIKLDLLDGSVDVTGKTASGLYTLTYRICERADLLNCATATVSIDLSGGF